MGARFLNFDGALSVAPGIGIGLMKKWGVDFMLYPLKPFSLSSGSDSNSDFGFLSADLHLLVSPINWLYIYAGPGLLYCKNKDFSGTSSLKSYTGGLYGVAGAKFLFGHWVLDAGVSYYPDVKVWGMNSVSGIVNYREYTPTTVISKGLYFSLGVGYAF